MPHPLKKRGISAAGCRRTNQLACLLAGLRRHKEELGPIADELLDLLERFGVRGARPWPGADQSIQRMISAPNAEQEICVAPSIRRAKS